MSSCMYVESKAERHLVPDVLNSSSKKMPNPMHSLKGIILTCISSGYVCATVVVMIVYEALNANRALQ